MVLPYQHRIILLWPSFASASIAEGPQHGSQDREKPKRSTQQPHPCWLAFTVQKGAVYTVWGERSKINNPTQLCEAKYSFHMQVNDFKVYVLHSQFQAPHPFVSQTIMTELHESHTAGVETFLLLLRRSGSELPPLDNCDHEPAHSWTWSSAAPAPHPIHHAQWGAE